MVGCTSAVIGLREATGKSVSASTADMTRPGASWPGAAPEEQTQRDCEPAEGRVPSVGLRKLKMVKSGPQFPARKLVKVEAPEPGDMVINPAIHAAMRRLVDLAEGRGEESTLVDFRFARSIRAALSRSTGICVAGLTIDPDMLEAFLGRCRDACDQLERVRRIG